MLASKASKIKHLPLFVYGKVVKGFGRGSKDLGIPTANLNEEAIDLLPHELEAGIYFGLASVNHGPVNKMVLSVGWNPFFHNKKKSMETHIMHEFKDDFYGALLKIILIGYIRPEKNFSSLDDLIIAIKQDISLSKQYLDEPVYKHFFTHKFWEKSVEGESGCYNEASLSSFITSNGLKSNHSSEENGINGEVSPQ